MDPHIAYRRTYSMTSPFGAAATELHLFLADMARLAKTVAARVSAVFAGQPWHFQHALSPAAPCQITPRPIKPPPPEALPLLTEAIVGSSKTTIVRVLGSPRSAMVEGLASIEQSDVPGYFQADTWYYSLPQHGDVAMAVTFAEDVAQTVEFFNAPQSDRVFQR